MEEEQVNYEDLDEIYLRDSFNTYGEMIEFWQGSRVLRENLKNGQALIGDPFLTSKKGPNGPKMQYDGIILANECEEDINRKFVHMENDNTYQSHKCAKCEVKPRNNEDLVDLS